MVMKAAFIFVAPEGNPDQHHADVNTPEVELAVFAVKDYAAAAVLARKLADQGLAAIELCGGFGIEGVAAVKQAVAGKAAVGVVRFDFHPGLEFHSGDDFFGSAA